MENLQLKHWRHLPGEEEVTLLQSGESVSVQKQPQQLARETLLADRANMTDSSTLVSYGTATGIVAATGDATEIGCINELIASADTLTTPLTKKITHFSGLLLWAILALAACGSVTRYLHGGGGIGHGGIHCRLNFSINTWRRCHDAPAVKQADIGIAMGVSGTEVAKEAARTVAVNMFIFDQTFYLFNCRSLHYYSMFKLEVFSNRWLVMGVVIMVLLPLLFIDSPAMKRLFGSAPIGATEWLVLAGGLLIDTVVEIEKWWRCRMKGRVSCG